MSNPISLNTANVQKFGAKVIFMLEEKKIRFDISNYTTFVSGGAARVKGINFEVTDPSGIPLSTIDFPNVDLNPTNGNTTYDLSIPNSFAIFGYWRITMAIKEADDRVYKLELQPIRLDQPKGYEKGTICGEFDYIVDCSVPKMLITEKTNLSYMGLQPVITTKVGMLYYPAGTLAPKSFTFTPFEIIGSNSLYTGTYTIRNKTKITYDLGNSVFVVLTYTTTKEFKVTCKSSLCSVLCCVEKLYAVYKKECNSDRGRDAKKKLEAIIIPLLNANLKEKCGKNASEEIAEIEKVLGCDCGCDGNESIEPTPIGGIGYGNSLTVDGQGATTVTPEVSGSTTIYHVSSKYVSVIKEDATDLAISIERVESGLNTIFKIGFDYKVLSTTILNTIKNSTQLTNLFNSIVNISTGTDLSLIDGKCIESINKCSYTLTKDVLDAEFVTGIEIDGVTYATPLPILLQNDTALASFLAGLNRGNFDVYFDDITKKTIITSADNSYLIKQLFTAVTVGNDTTPMSTAFIIMCKGLRQIIQAIIDYICKISTLQIRIGDELRLCVLDKDGNVIERVFSKDEILYKYLAEQAAAFCAMAQQVQTITKIDCASIKQIFAESSADITEKDFVLGTKDGGKCSRISFKDIAMEILIRIKESSELHSIFCTLVADCSKQVCYPVENVTIQVVPDDAPGISPEFDTDQQQDFSEDEFN